MTHLDHPLIIKLKKLRRSDEILKSAEKLLTFADKFNVLVALEPDEEDDKNPGVYDHSNRKVTIDPKIVKNSMLMLIVFLHELGHVVQLNESDSEHKLTARYPASVKADGFFVEEGMNKSLIRSQKYWIDSMGFEFEAWGIAQSLADELKIEIDYVEWTKFKYSCMRKTISWLKYY